MTNTNESGTQWVYGLDDIMYPFIDKTGGETDRYLSTLDGLTGLFNTDGKDENSNLIKQRDDLNKALGETIFKARKLDPSIPTIDAMSKSTKLLWLMGIKNGEKGLATLCNMREKQKGLPDGAKKTIGEWDENGVRSALRYLLTEKQKKLETRLRPDPREGNDPTQFAIKRDMGIVKTALDRISAVQKPSPVPVNA